MKYFFSAFFIAMLFQIFFLVPIIEGGFWLIATVVSLLAGLVTFGFIKLSDRIDSLEAEIKKLKEESKTE